MPICLGRSIRNCEYHDRRASLSAYRESSSLLLIRLDCLIWLWQRKTYQLGSSRTLEYWRHHSDGNVTSCSCLPALSSLLLLTSTPYICWRRGKLTNLKYLELHGSIDGTIPTSIDGTIPTELCVSLGGHRFLFAMSHHRFFSQLVVFGCGSSKLTNLTYLALTGNMAGTIPTEM
jgi:hypothetical protein